MDLEVGQQGEEDGQRELEDLRYGGDAIFGQRHAEILFDGVDKHLMGAKHWPGALQHREQQLQGDNLGPQLVRSAKRRNCGSVSTKRMSFSVKMKKERSTIKRFRLIPS